MDFAWAARELEEFISLAGTAKAGAGLGYPQLVQRLRGQELVVHRIADVVWPEWRAWSFPNYNQWWSRTYDLAQRCLMLVERQEELETRLGDPGPKLAASTLHPWVWEAAQSLWSSGHYAQAVTAAAMSINGFLQKKGHRRDASEADLVVECFSPEPPKPGRPRLRLMDDDGSKTFRSMQQGSLAFGQGCYIALRNPLSHEHNLLQELPESEALEQLAAFSLLARWIERSVLVRAREDDGRDVPPMEAS
jgi:hypothetical protein